MMYNVYMKKFLFIFLIFFTCMRIFAWEFVNLPREYSWYYDEMANKNILPHNADVLEKKHNVKVHIYKYKGNENDEIYDKAEEYFNKLTEKDDKGQLLIWIGTKKEEGYILVTDDLKNRIGGQYLKILQDDVLRSLLGRWYISEARVLGKVLGGIVYLLEKDTLSKEEISRIKSDVIVVDDFFFVLSCKPVFSEIIGLFNFEPVSFFFYFPFVVHFIFVRVIGMKFHKTGFIISNFVWVFFMFFVFYLIFNRIDIFFHEYVQLFCMFLGLNVPLFFFLINLYRNELETAAYNYLRNVTGDF
ncbi:MAG TPA: hypothetical protein PLF61_02500, partial [Candidatus Goldiibacteriota bacterium]|nr:hypothetical protein [Candidatus Goldiibacteriota bacterium]